MPIDSMELAYLAFQSCRCSIPEAGALLAALIPTLEEVKESGALVLDVPESCIEPLPTDWKREIERSSDVERTVLHQDAMRWFDLCYISAVELQRLWDEHNREAVRSLGYAMHDVPSLISSGGAARPPWYSFGFRVAAFHWSDYSIETRKALADIAGVSVDRVDELVKNKDYGVDMFGIKSSPERPDGEMERRNSPEKLSFLRHWLRGKLR